MTIFGEEPQSALLLTDQEWSDLADIAEMYLGETNWIEWCNSDHPMFQPGGGSEPLLRRRDLAKRIVEAAS